MARAPYLLVGAVWALLAPSASSFMAAPSKVAPPLAQRAATAARLPSPALSPRMQAAAAIPNPVSPPRSWTVKGEMVTPGGFALCAAVFFTAFMVQIPVLLCYLWSQLFDKKRRRGVDWVITFWAWFSMRVCGYRPEVVGLENLPKNGENCLYVPNHTSFLDILTLTGFIPRPMKYVSKASILKIPFIGWPMRLAAHIALKEDSRRSQLETFKDTIASLQDGNSVITFPEGTRAVDGKLKPFKRGPFKMAISAQKPIVPVTISGLARWYPKGMLIPIGVPKGVKITIHPVVDVPNCGLDEGALTEAVYQTVNSALPDEQKADAEQPAIAT